MASSSFLSHHFFIFFSPDPGEGSHENEYGYNQFQK